MPSNVLECYLTIIKKLVNLALLKVPIRRRLSLQALVVLGAVGMKLHFVAVLSTGSWPLPSSRALLHINASAYKETCITLWVSEVATRLLSRPLF